MVTCCSSDINPTAAEGRAYAANLGSPQLANALKKSSNTTMACFTLSRPHDHFFIACPELIYRGIGLCQREGRYFNVKLFFTLVDHLVGAVH